jgi:hypothetical protein
MTQASFEAQGDYAFEREDYVHASAQYTLVNSFIRSVAA